MLMTGTWLRVWIYLGCVWVWAGAARPRFDTSTDMGLVLVPADAEIDSVIFRLRATDQDVDFPLVFDITATVSPVVKIDNLPCTLYNKVCQANVVLTKRLIPGRLHDFAVRVRDSKGDSNSMQATISVTNATTPRDTIFPHIPSLIMVPENTKPGKELDYLLVRANAWSGKPVYIELWQPKELFTIRQRQTPSQTRGVITLIGELDFETQSMYTLTMYATDPYTEPGKDTRNIAGLNIVVVVQDVQDVPPIFTLAPPLTKLNNTVRPGDIILRVHAEDGDKGVPREITYGLVSEGNPFTPFFNISETTGEIALVRPLEELTQISHVGAPIVLTVVAEEIRRLRDEPPAQATIVDVGLLLGEPGNSPPYFATDNYVVTIDENLEPGTPITFPDQYTTRVKDEDIGKAGVFALKLENNNGTFEVTPAVAERTADFVITVRDNTMIDYETRKSLAFKIIAQEVGPATNLSATAPVVIFLRDVNDNPPVFDVETYNATLSENETLGTRVVQVHATDRDTGLFGDIQYTRITGEGSEAFAIDPHTGLITVASKTMLDRELASRLQLTVEARDEQGRGNRGTVALDVNLIDVNDNPPIFEKEYYIFTLNYDLSNFTVPAIVKATDADAEPPNNIVRYEIVHGNYENKFYLNEITGELMLRSPISTIRRKKQSNNTNTIKNKFSFRQVEKVVENKSNLAVNITFIPPTTRNEINEITKNRKKRASDDALYILIIRAYDLGVPHLYSETQVRVIPGASTEPRLITFVVPGEHPDPVKTAETLAAITGGKIHVLEIRPYVERDYTLGNIPNDSEKRSIVVARVEQNGINSFVDIEKIRKALAANGVGIISGMDGMSDSGNESTHMTNGTILHNDEVTVYKAENKLLFWLLVILGLLVLAAIAALIICCICPGCPFYMAPRKRRVHSSHTIDDKSNGRPMHHLQRRHATIGNGFADKKQAWSADPTKRNWQFNRRNTRQCGLASLPGDVAYLPGQSHELKINMESMRPSGGPAYDYEDSKKHGEENLYVEDMDQKPRGYEMADIDSLRRHEYDRGSDMHRQGFRFAGLEREREEREQHFYREGNAEVLRLVTRGQAEDNNIAQIRGQPMLIVDGKDILLRRFIEDQKIRHDGSFHEVEAGRSIDSHQCGKDSLIHQQEILLIPERLENTRIKHIEEIGPNVQRFVIDHTDKEGLRESQLRETQLKQEQSLAAMVASAIGNLEKPIAPSKDQQPSTNTQSYSYRDMELARQNALLTRLLLERESRAVGISAMDSTSYLETQSLPGQVAIATQTDRTTATQTERPIRSRSDNDESEDEQRMKKRTKSKKRWIDGDTRKGRTSWMKSPIEEEEDPPCFDKRLNILRKKFKEVKENRKISLEPDVLREISDSLNGNESSYSREGISWKENEDEEAINSYRCSTEETSVKYKILNENTYDSQSSSEKRREERDNVFGEKTNVRGHRKVDTNESTSSPEIRSEKEKSSRGESIEKSLMNEDKNRSRQSKSEDSPEPSFRILEKEISMLTKKISKLGEKIDRSTDKGVVREKISPKKISKRGLPTKTIVGKKEDMSGTSKSSADRSSKSQLEHVEVQRNEKMKSKPKLKHQPAPVISTASSEYEDSEKSKKQDLVKQKALVQSHEQSKTKQNDAKRILEQNSEIRKSTISKESKSEESIEKPIKLLVKKKLAIIGRRDHVLEDRSASTSSEKTERKKTVNSDSEKKSNTSSSDHSIIRISQRKSKKNLERSNAKLTDSRTGSVHTSEKMRNAKFQKQTEQTEKEEKRRASLQEMLIGFASIDNRLKTEINQNFQKEESEKKDDNRKIKEREEENQKEEIEEREKYEKKDAEINNLESKSGYSQEKEYKFARTDSYTNAMKSVIKDEKIEPLTLVLEIAECTSAISKNVNNNKSTEKENNGIIQSESIEQIEEGEESTGMLEIDYVTKSDIQPVELNEMRECRENKVEDVDNNGSQIFADIKTHENDMLNDRKKHGIFVAEYKDKIVDEQNIANLLTQDTLSTNIETDEIIDKIKFEKSQKVKVGDNTVFLPVLNSSPVSSNAEKPTLDVTDEATTTIIPSESTVNVDKHLKEEQEFIELEKITLEEEETEDRNERNKQEIGKDISLSDEAISSIHEEITVEEGNYDVADQSILGNQYSTIKNQHSEVNIVRERILNIADISQPEEKLQEVHKNSMEYLEPQLAQETNEKKKDKPKSDHESEPENCNLQLLINTLDIQNVSDDSDLSSDTSRKTTLKAEPYQTPRHKTQISQGIEQMDIQTMKTSNNLETSGDSKLEINAQLDGHDYENEKITSHRMRTETDNFAQNNIYERKEPQNVDSVDGEIEKPALINTIHSDLKIHEKMKVDAVAVSIPSIENKLQEEIIGTPQVQTHLEKITTTESEVEGLKMVVGKQEKKDKLHLEKFRASPRKERRIQVGEQPEATAPMENAHSRVRRKSKENQGKKKLDQTKQTKKKDEDKPVLAVKTKLDRDKKTWGVVGRSTSPPKIGGEMVDTSKTQSKYMAWYKQKRDEMEKKRAESKKNDEEEQLPRWLRRSLNYRKSLAEHKKIKVTPDVTPRTKRKVKPLVNVESEQLKAIVRQGRMLRRAEGAKEDPSIEIFATSPPAIETKDHHLVQHSEYKYEKLPPPFYLHLPPAPHPSPELSPEHFDGQSDERRRVEDDLDSGIAVSLQGGNRLRHQQLLEKKSVFDIAYSEAAPSQLRADSATPPS